jgi:hypothetical protein
VPAQDRLNTWTLGGIAIDQVSTYYLGVVYQEMDHGTRARRSQRCKAAFGCTGGHCCHTAFYRQRSDCSWFRFFIYSGHVWRGVWETRRGQSKTRPAVVSSPAFTLHPRLLLTFCTGTLGYFHPVYSLMLRAVLAAQILFYVVEMAQGEAYYDSQTSRSSSVGQRVSTDWCSNVKSITRQISTPLNIHQGDCTGKGQPACVRVASRHQSHKTRHHT